MAILVLIAIAIALGAATVRYQMWARSRRVRFTFEDRDTYLFLGVDRLLSGDDGSLVTMRALREALRLKVAAGFSRVVVDASGLRIASTPAFWRLVGALGPALLDGNVKLALVCRDRGPVTRRFREAGFFDTFAREAEAVSFLKSAQASRPLGLEPGWVDSLLVA